MGAPAEGAAPVRDKQLLRPLLCSSETRSILETANLRRTGKALPKRPHPTSTRQNSRELCMRLAKARARARAGGREQRSRHPCQASHPGRVSLGALRGRSRRASPCSTLQRSRPQEVPVRCAVCLTVLIDGNQPDKQSTRRPCTHSFCPKPPAQKSNQTLNSALCVIRITDPTGDQSYALGIRHGMRHGADQKMQPPKEILGFQMRQSSRKGLAQTS